jgi:hypothetical protein
VQSFLFLPVAVAVVEQAIAKLVVEQQQRT